MPKDIQVHISVVLPQSLRERLIELRWKTRAPSFVALVRDLLEESAERREKELEQQVELVS